MAMVEQASSGQPDKSCDIVLKGGITSGVVYPLALVSLSQKYRFSNIGGTSAGAIAAAAAAAAEYGRPIAGAGFDRLAKIPSRCRSQPALDVPADAGFKAAVRYLRHGLEGQDRDRANIRWYPGSGQQLLAAVRCSARCLASSSSWPPALFHGGAGFALLGLLLALLGLAVALIWRLWKAARVDLVGSDFGLCPGIRQSYACSEGFTDWLARLIDEAADSGWGPSADIWRSGNAAGQRPPTIFP